MSYNRFEFSAMKSSENHPMTSFTQYPCTAVMQIFKSHIFKSLGQCFRWPFCFGRFDTLISKIENVMRQILIQHQKIILEPSLDKFYSKMPWQVKYSESAPWLLTLLKINRLLHIYISIVPLQFGVDIQSQTKVRVWKPKNPIWPPGSHFESDLAENQ